MADINKIRILVGGIPTTIDLTATGNVFKAENFKLTDATVTASKPLKLDADKKFTSGNIDLTSEVTGILPVANGGTNSNTALNNNRVIKSASGAIVEAAAITASRALVSDADGIPTHSAVTSTELGYVSGATSSIQAQINALSTSYSRRMAVKSIVVSNTDPATLSDGRYILAIDAETIHASYTSAGIAKGDIFTVATEVPTKDVTPLEGYIAYVDDVNKDALYVDDGTPAWELRITAVNDHGDLQGLGDDDHTQYHNDTRGDTRYYQKTEFLQTSAGSGDAGKPVKLDADGNIDATMINDADIDHASLTNTHNLTTDIDHASIANTHNLTTDIDHGSISGLGDDDHTQYLKADGTRALTGKQSYSTHPTFSDDKELVDKKYVDDAVAAAAPDSIDFALVAGETFAANSTFAVRMAVSGETAGRVYKATSDEENASGKYRVIGFVQTTSEVEAGGTVTVVKFIKDIALKSADAVIGASAADQGKYLYLNKAGVVSINPAAGISAGAKYAVVLLGILNEYNATNTSEKILMDVGVGGFQGIDLGPVV